MSAGDPLRGIVFAIIGAALASPYAIVCYEQANALSCCENPGGDGIVLAAGVIPVAVLALWPLMALLSRKLRGRGSVTSALALVAIGALAGALVGWTLFRLFLLPSDTVLDLTFGTWGIAPGALVGAGAAIGWWIGTEHLGRKKVKNG